MSRLSGHLPSLGALVLAVALAGVAYSIYDGQSTQRDGGESSARGAGLTADFPLPRAEHKPRSVEAKPKSVDSGKRAYAVTRSGTDHVSRTTPAVTLEPVAPPSPVSAPRSRPAPDRGRSVDRELRRLIDQPVAPRPAPRRPKGGTPVTPTPRPKTPNVGTPGGSPPVQSPATGPVTTPAPDPTPAADPEAGLDDTAVGGLDQTDLGEPVDETDTGTSTDTGAVPPAGANSAPAAAVTAPPTG